MERAAQGQLGRVASAAIVVQASPSHPGAKQVTINAALAPPDKAMFADHVRVDQTRDGVRVLFGKLHPIDSNQCISAVEISFPQLAFYNQLYKSLSVPQPDGRTFLETVDGSLEGFSCDRISRDLDPVAAYERVVPIRANYASIAAHGDDAAIDFFHIDAPTLHAASQVADNGFAATPGFRGVIRIVVSLPLLVYFLGKIVQVAEKIKREHPRVDDFPFLTGAES
jgi:hypothetical protein